jgi:hypothetical protein
VDALGHPVSFGYACNDKEPELELETGATARARDVAVTTEVAEVSPLVGDEPLPSVRAKACSLDAKRAPLGTEGAQRSLDSGTMLAWPHPVLGLSRSPGG